MRTVPGCNGARVEHDRRPVGRPAACRRVAPVLPPLPASCDPSPPFTLQAASASAEQRRAPTPWPEFPHPRRNLLVPEEVSIRGAIVQITPGTQPGRAAAEDVTRVMRENADQEPDTETLRPQAGRRLAAKAAPRRSTATSCTS